MAMKLFTTFLPYFLFSSAIFTGIIIHPLANNSVYANQSKKTETKIPETVRNVGVRVEIHGVVNGKEQIQNGSGVIISRNGNQYTVLTADHLLFATFASDRPYIYDPKYQEDYKGKLFIVVNNIRYQVTPDNIYRLRQDRRIGLDLALIRFTSNENYPVAKLDLRAGQFDPVNIYGWPNPTNKSPQPNEYEERYLTSNIYNLGDPDYSGRSIVRGYTMSYDADIDVLGLSGGPVFDENEEFVIGIHGAGKDIRSEIPTIDNIFVQDKSLINRTAATPIDTFLDQLPSHRKYDRDSLFGKIDESLPGFLTGLNKDQTSAQPNKSENTKITARGKYRDAVMLIRVKKFSKAINLLKDVVDLQPDYAIAHLALGDAYYQNVDSSDSKKKKEAKNKAFAEYDKAENLLGNKEIQPDIILRKASIFSSIKEYKNARTELNKLKSKNLPYLNIICYINQALIDRNDINQKDKSKGKNLAEARKEIQKSLKQNAESLRKHETSSENLKNQLVVTRAKNAFYLLAIGKEYYQADYLEDNEGKKGNQGKKIALEIFDEAIAVDPDDVSTYLAISTFLLYKDQATASDYFQRLEKQKSHGPEILSTISEKYESDFKSLAQAIMIANQVVDKDRQNPEAYFERGQLLEKNKQNKKAIDDFKQALKLFRERNNNYGALSVSKKLCHISPEDNPEGCPATSLPPNKPPATNQVSKTTTQTTVTPDSTFSCDPKTSNLTLRTVNEKQHILINWQSTAFTPSGYNPQIRCQQVSARLQKFQKEGRLNPENITSSVRTYKIQKDGDSIPYSLNVLCVAKSSSDAATKICAEDGLIITLERGEKPEQILKQFRQALVQNFTGEPLIKGVKSKTETVPEP